MITQPTGAQLRCQAVRHVPGTDLLAADMEYEGRLGLVEGVAAPHMERAPNDAWRAPDPHAERR